MEYCIIKQLFQEKQYFWKKLRKTICGKGVDMTILRGRGHLATKINIAFFVEYEALNIFIQQVKKKTFSKIMFFCKILSYPATTFQRLFKSWKSYHEKGFVWNVWWKNWSNTAFLLSKIFHLKPLNANFTSHLHLKNYKKMFLDFSHTQRSDAANTFSLRNNTTFCRNSQSTITFLALHNIRRERWGFKTLGTWVLVLVLPYPKLRIGFEPTVHFTILIICYTHQTEIMKTLHGTFKKWSEKFREILKLF